MCDPCCLPMMCCEISCEPSCCPKPSFDPCCPPSCCPKPSCDPCCDPCPPSCCPKPCPSMCCPPPKPCPPSPCPSSCKPKLCSPCGPCCPPACPPKRCKSRELRGGNLITNCECVKRNGLQLDCPRSECRGRPRCVTKPFPICCPSKYMWRYANVTMGKSAAAEPKKPCCPAPGDCNPCAFPSWCE